MSILGFKTIDPRINNLVCQPVLEFGSTPNIHDHFRATTQEGSNSNAQRYRNYSPGDDAHYCHAARQRRMATIFLIMGISCTMFIVLSLPRTRDRDEGVTGGNPGSYLGFPCPWLGGKLAVDNGIGGCGGFRRGLWDVCDLGFCWSIVATDPFWVH